MDWLGEDADELAALILVMAGVYMVLAGHYNQGVSLISMGTSYLFGKHSPKKGMPVGGLPNVR